jgi:hypothetical protein
VLDADELLLRGVEDEPPKGVEELPATALEVMLASRGPITRVPHGLEGAETQPPKYVPKLPVELLAKRTCAGA